MHTREKLQKKEGERIGGRGLKWYKEERKRREERERGR